MLQGCKVARLQGCNLAWVQMCNDKNHNTTDQQCKSLVYVIFVLFWHVQIVSNSPDGFSQQMKVNWKVQNQYLHYDMWGNIANKLFEIFSFHTNYCTVGSYCWDNHLFKESMGVAGCRMRVWLWQVAFYILWGQILNVGTLQHSIPQKPIVIQGQLGLYLLHPTM